MSYGASIADGYRQAGVYVGRILNGEKPERITLSSRPSKSSWPLISGPQRLSVNIPAIAILARADEVIE